MTTEAPLLTLTDATIGYETARPLLSGVRLELRPGEVIALVGESGIGKTTLLKTAAGLLRPLTGRLNVLGISPPRRPPRGSVGYIPQRLGLVMHATTLENVVMGGLHREPTWRIIAKTPHPEHLHEAREALACVGIDDKADVPIKHLSGGQQRRVATARALFQRPRILLADEFLSELDRRTARIVEDAVMALAEQHGTGILLVEHHVAKARQLADRVYEMNEGRLVEITDPATARLDEDADVAEHHGTTTGDAAPLPPADPSHDNEAAP